MGNFGGSLVYLSSTTTAHDYATVSWPSTICLNSSGTVTFLLPLDPSPPPPPPSPSASHQAYLITGVRTLGSQRWKGAFFTKTGIFLWKRLNKFGSGFGFGFPSHEIKTINFCVIYILYLWETQPRRLSCLDTHTDICKLVLVCWTVSTWLVPDLLYDLCSIK